MTSRLVDEFWACYRRLPVNVGEVARKNYKLWAIDPRHPSLHFKPVNDDPLIYSIRVGMGWRATAFVDGDDVAWFWIGSHADYDRILDSL